MPTRATWRNPLGTVQSLENVYGDKIFWEAYIATVEFIGW
jgi:hypothetical protein